MTDPADSGRTAVVSHFTGKCVNSGTEFYSGINWAWRASGAVNAFKIEPTSGTISGNYSVIQLA